jgi:hypothetical protein
MHQALIIWLKFGYRSILFWWSVFGNDKILRHELGIGIGIALVVQTVSMWASDMFASLSIIPALVLIGG